MKTCVVIFISDKIDFHAKDCKRQEEIYLMIKVTAIRDFINAYTLNIGTSNK